MIRGMFGVFATLLCICKCSNDSILAMMDICPFNNFCTRPATEVINNDLGKPCCRTCSCSDDCAYFGNCCPDKTWFSEPQITGPLPNCVSTNQTSDFYNGEDATETGIHITNYIVIDSCPQNNETTCQRGNELQDYIFVSAKTDGRIFRNKKCAECNGVFDFFSWQLALGQCPDTIYYISQNLDEDVVLLNRIILENCSLQVLPPESVKEKLPIFECLKAESACSDTVLKDDCTEGGVYYRHNFFLYKRRVFQNYFCFKCVYTNEIAEEQCTKESKSVKPASSFFAILDHSYFAKRDTGICKIHEVFDPYKKHCAPLLCPKLAFPKNGICQEVTTVVHGLLLRIQLKLFVVSTLKNDTMKKDIGVSVLKAYFSECMSAGAVCLSTIFPETANAIILDAILYSNFNKGCFEDNVMKNLSTLLNERGSVEVKLNENTFSLFAVVLSDKNIEDRTGIQIYGQLCPPTRIYSITKSWFYDCPYLNIDFLFLKSSGVSDDVINKMRLLSLDIEGYVASICLDTYLTIFQTNFGNIISLNAFLFVMSVLTFVKLAIVQ